jgi:hypothetical protein
MQKGFFGSLFDFDGDGELNAAESTYDLMRFNEIMNDADKINELENAGTTYEDLWYMSDYERREKIEEAGLDPDDYDFG